MVSFGVANALSSVTVGRLEKVTGRVFLFTLAAILNLAVLVFLVFWGYPDGDGGRYEFVLYLIPVFWGIADSIWQATTCSKWFFKNLFMVMFKFCNGEIHTSKKI